MRATSADEEIGWDGYIGLTGLSAFIVSSPVGDSIPQGASTCEPGEIDAAMTELMVAAHLLRQPFFASEWLASEAAAELLNTVAEETNPSAFGQCNSRLAGLSSARRAVFVFLPVQPFFSTRPRELAAIRFLAQSVLAYAEIVSFVSEPHIATDGHQRCVIWQQSGVC
jgi:hypothetical protein